MPRKAADEPAQRGGGFCDGWEYLCKRVAVAVHETLDPAAYLAQFQEMGVFGGEHFVRRNIVPFAVLEYSSRNAV